MVSSSQHYLNSTFFGASFHLLHVALALFSPPDLSIVLNRAIRGSAEPQLDSTCTYSTLKRNKATCFSSQGARRVGWGAPDYAQLRAHSKLSGNLTDYCTPLSRSISLDSEYAEPDEWSCDSSQENLYVAPQPFVVNTDNAIVIITHCCAHALFNQNSSANVKHGVPTMAVSTLSSSRARYSPLSSICIFIIVCMHSSVQSQPSCSQKYMHGIATSVQVQHSPQCT